MLENLALSISTAIFLLCNLFVNSFGLSMAQSSGRIWGQESVPAAAVSDTAEDFVLAGEWNSGGRIFEFTKTGKLIYNGKVMPYEIDGGTMTVVYKIGSAERTVKLEYKPLGGRVLSLGGVTLYRVDP